MRFSNSDFLSPEMREPSLPCTRNPEKLDEDMQRVRQRLLNYIYKNHTDREQQRQRGMSLSMELVND